jgi:NADPH:quinone reductase-like Zn-dependent oxidoreductase
MMRAVYVVPGSDGGVLEYREVPIPAPAPGEVLVAIRAAGTNRGELLARPLLRSTDPALRPMRAGIEFAGEISALGSGVSGWPVGDRVMGRAIGSYANYTSVNQRALMRIPAGLSFSSAAAIPNVFVTAHDALVSAAAVKPGDAVIVTAGSSGVGTAAIQIAHHLGANPVIATTRTASKSGALRELGAHEVLDTTSASWVDDALRATAGRGADVIIDQVGGPMLPGNLRALAIKGRLVSVGRNAGNVGDCDLDELARKRVSIIGVTFRTRSPEEAIQCSERFAADLLDSFAIGALKPVLDRTFPFERLADAHAYMLSDAQIGKIVLTMHDAG